MLTAQRVGADVQLNWKASGDDEPDFQRLRGLPRDDVGRPAGSGSFVTGTPDTMLIGHESAAGVPLLHRHRASTCMRTRARRRTRRASRFRPASGRHAALDATHAGLERPQPVQRHHAAGGPAAPERLVLEVYDVAGRRVAGRENRGNSAQAGSNVRSTAATERRRASERRVLLPRHRGGRNANAQDGDPSLTRRTHRKTRRPGRKPVVRACRCLWRQGHVQNAARMVTIECHDVWKSFARKACCVASTSPSSPARPSSSSGRAARARASCSSTSSDCSCPTAAACSSTVSTSPSCQPQKAVRAADALWYGVPGRGVVRLAVGGRERRPRDARAHRDSTTRRSRGSATEKLHMVGLDGVGDKLPAELSGGMKKRVGFARAIAMNPQCVLYDEPTTGLDPIMADVINNLIIKLARRAQDHERRGHARPRERLQGRGPDRHAARRHGHLRGHTGRGQTHQQRRSCDSSSKDARKVPSSWGAPNDQPRTRDSRGRGGVLAARCAVIGTMWFQKFQLAEKRYHFFVRFNEVGGLLVGDPDLRERRRTRPGRGDRSRTRPGGRRHGGARGRPDPERFAGGSEESRHHGRAQWWRSAGSVSGRPSPPATRSTASS